LGYVVLCAAADIDWLADKCTVEVLKSNRPPLHKLLWSVLVFLFPIGGVIIYWLFSDRAKWNSGAGGYEPIA
jgi:hypothetical protein